MHLSHRFCTLTIAWATAIAAMGTATAQPTNAQRNATALCNAEKTALETRMELARSKGQMLLRRQLADQLTTVQAGCKPLSADQSRAVNIERLEKEVQALRMELDLAQEQLRKLKSEASR